MQFFGAVHYYFWQGIHAGASGKEFEPLNLIESKTALQCEDFYHWGYLFGQTMGKREVNLCLKVKKKKPIVNEPIEIDKLDKDYPLIGEC